jgi:hypothetical protein
LLHELIITTIQDTGLLEVITMKPSAMLAVATLATASISLLAQQPPSGPAPNAAFSPVASELMNRLDSKTAKTGDRVLLKTKSTVRTADGMEIPKGSKLIGHVIAAKPSSAVDENAQIALQFDRIELKSGQTLLIHSEIEALSPSVGAASNAADASASSPSPSSPGHAPGDMYGSSPSPMANTRIEARAPVTSSAAPTSGTLVAHTGSIEIRTTSIPGVLLAVNEAGQHDPRKAQSSGILLRTKRDIHLDEGTNFVLGVTASGAKTGDN